MDELTAGSSGPEPGSTPSAWTPAGSSQARSGQSIASWLMGGLVVCMLVDVASVMHNLSGRTLLDRYASGAIGDAGLSAWDSTFASIGLAQFGVFIVTALIWLAWQHRLVSSVQPLGLGEPHKTPGRSILWWFVPIANLVVVYRVYKDLQAKFDPDSGSIVGQWWGAYLVSGAVANGAARYWALVESESSFMTGLTLWLVSDAVSIVSALVALRMVRRLQAGQSRALAAPPPPPPPPSAIVEPPMPA